MLVKIDQWQKWTQEDEGFPMVRISFHIYVWIYSGSSRSKQAMASWSRKKKEPRLKMNITSRDFHAMVHHSVWILKSWISSPQNITGSQLSSLRNKDGWDDIFPCPQDLPTSCLGSLVLTLCVPEDLEVLDAVAAFDREGKVPGTRLAHANDEGSLQKKRDWSDGWLLICFQRWLGKGSIFNVWLSLLQSPENWSMVYSTR